MLHTLVRLLIRILMAVVIAVLVMLLPIPAPAPAWLPEWHVPIVVVLLVCYIGKLLYDTLFYDHYRP